ncbi:MAG: preprotein translocase subunit SecE [Vulcanimicrobiaceae bacterium]
MSRVTTGSTTTRSNPPTRPGPRDAERAARSARTQEFFRGLVSEMRRVTWPAREEWIAATLLTVGLVVAIAIYTYVLDEGFGALFSLVHK